MKCWTTNFSIHASECPVIIMNQLKSVYNIPFLDSYSNPIHTCLSMIASNEVKYSSSEVIAFSGSEQCLFPPAVEVDSRTMHCSRNYYNSCLAEQTLSCTEMRYIEKLTLTLTPQILSPIYIYIFFFFFFFLINVNRCTILKHIWSKLSTTPNPSVNGAYVHGLMFHCYLPGLMFTMIL